LALSADDSLKEIKHAMITNAGHLLVDSIGVKKLPKRKTLIKIKGDDVWKSFQS
jgi:hypothetical protein